jgi:D-glycero-beta-D-manno-heptose 1-phosphate adenylyltransferase
MEMSIKVFALEDLLEIIKPLAGCGQKIVFTNGCFDILHTGHVRYLSAAKAQGDVLVVGLNSDLSVRNIKGEKRPILDQNERAEIIAALACVNYVTIFDALDPLDLVTAIGPDVIVKGADWAEDDIIGADVVKEKGGRVERISIVPGASTSGIIEKILARYGGGR